MFHEAETWVAIAFLFFVALLAYLGVHKQIVAALDKRSAKIKDELDEARRLKDEAMSLLAQYQRKRQEAETGDDLTPKTPEASGTAVPATANRSPAVVDPADPVVLAYCTAVRGILNDDQGGPLHPPGLRMAEALQEVRASIQRNLDEEKGGFAEEQLGRLAGCIDRGLGAVQEVQETIREYVGVIAGVAATLEPGTEDCTERQEKFEGLIDRFEATADPIRHHMATVMLSFLAGLFVGEEELEEIRDNLDLERWFRLPKSHERRIHGHRHAGIRIVLEGPTLVHALDAPGSHPGPFTVEDLLPYRTAREPPCQAQARNRRTIMRKARSKKKRPLLLADLERRYRETSIF